MASLFSNRPSRHTSHALVNGSGGDRASGLAINRQYIVVSLSNGYMLVHDREGSLLHRVQAVDPRAGALEALVLLPNLVVGAVYTYRSGGVIGVWDPATGRQLHSLRGATSRITNLVAVNETTIVAASEDLDDAPAVVWDVSDGRRLATLVTQSSVIRTMAIHGSTLVTGDDDASVRLWDLERQLCIADLLGHTDTVMETAIAAVHVASGANDGTVRVWRRDDLQCLAALDVHGHFVRNLHLTLDEHYVVCTTAPPFGAVQVWNLRTLSLEHEIPAHDEDIHHLDVRNGVCVTASSDARLVFSDVGCGSVVGALNAPRVVHLVRFDREDGARVVFVQDRGYVLGTVDGTPPMYGPLSLEICDF